MTTDPDLTALRDALIAVGVHPNEILDDGGLIPATCTVLRRLHGNWLTAQAQLVDAARERRAPADLRPLYGRGVPVSAETASRVVGRQAVVR